MRPSLLLSAILAIVGCSSSPSSHAPSGADPASGRVFLHGVTLAPCKYDGSAWDGLGKIEVNQLSLLGSLVRGRVPYVEIASFLAQPANQSLEKPEVFGTAVLLENDRSMDGPPVALAAQQDTFTPQFQGPPSWSHVPFDGSARLVVELKEKDLLVADDPVGTFMIGPRDMLDALHAGKVHQVRVDDQTNGQVLFAAISVMAE